MISPTIAPFGAYWDAGERERRERPSSEFRLRDITVDYVKKNYLLPYGNTNDGTNPLSDGEGNEIKDHLIHTHILNSIAEAEDVLGMFISPKVVKTKPIERGITDYDIEGRPLQYNWSNGVRVFPELHLPHSNIISVDRVAVWFGQLEVTTIPASWIVITAKKEGSISIVPLGGGNIVLTSNILYGLAARGNMYQDKIPGFWVCDYTCGLDILSRSIADYICMRTALVVLGITAMARYHGVSAESESVDGLSENYSTIASGQYGRYGDLQNLFTTLSKDFAKKRVRYRGMRVASV